MSTPTHDLASPELEKAFTALRAYDTGSSRGDLMPLDAAARASLANPEARRTLENRLAALLRETIPAPAKAHICGLLGLIGSAASTSALGECLGVEALSQPARGALEAMPCPEAGQVLRRHLPKLSAPLQRGAIHSLGRRRESESVAALISLLEKADAQTRDSIAAALGHIATPEAIQGLRQIAGESSPEVSLMVADACLTAAERLFKENQKREAAALCSALAAKKIPAPARQALRRFMPD